MLTETKRDIVFTVADDQEEIDQAELRGFSHTLSQIEWLLTILVILYLELPGSYVADKDAVILALIAFTLFILTLHYLRLKRHITRFGLAVETWVMIALITFVLWHTGKIDSPLVSLYFLVIITAATAFGKNVAFLEVGLISACFLKQKALWRFLQPNGCGLQLRIPPWKYQTKK